MENPCVSDEESLCSSRNKEQILSTLVNGNNLRSSNPPRVDHAPAQLQRPKIVNTYQRRLPALVKRRTEDGGGTNASGLTNSSSELPIRNQQKLPETDSENCTKTRLLDKQKLFVSNLGKAAGMSQTETTSNLRTSNRKVQIQSGKSSQAQLQQPVAKSSYSAETSKREGSHTAQSKKNYTEAVRNSRNQLPAGFKQIWQVKERIEPIKDSPESLTKTWREKEKKEKSKDSSKSSTKINSSKKHSRQKAPIYHIKWEDPDKTNAPVGHNCSLCENDLAYSQLETDSLFENHNLPNVALLLCGHVFHMLCLELAMPEEQLKDPPCFICDSLADFRQLHKNNVNRASE